MLIAFHLTGQTSLLSSCISYRSLGNHHTNLHKGTFILYLLFGTCLTPNDHQVMYSELAGIYTGCKY
jgi:hypothetical protein